MYIDCSFGLACCISSNCSTLSWACTSFVNSQLLILTPGNVSEMASSEGWVSGSVGGIPGSVVEVNEFRWISYHKYSASGFLHLDFLAGGLVAFVTLEGTFFFPSQVFGSEAGGGGDVPASTYSCSLFLISSYEPEI